MVLTSVDFYARNTESVARDLLGKKLVRYVLDDSGKQIKLSGVICETEAYGSNDDPASHAFRGMTSRNSVMFGDVGKAYVYLIYGIHHCMNVTARSSNYDAGAVLIRSLIPVEGVNIMMYFSNVKQTSTLTTGPGKLTKAMNINRSHNGLSLTESESSLQIEDGIRPKKVVNTARVGISRAKEKYWRYFIAGDISMNPL